MSAATALCGMRARSSACNDKAREIEITAAEAASPSYLRQPLRAARAREVRPAALSQEQGLRE
jgi:hypothetical protein